MIIRVIDGIGGLEMEKETDFYTGTMAKVYAGQGHWDKAAEIYRHGGKNVKYNRQPSG
jgi:hypothetical protein